jgi:hypothetical protein
MQALLALLVGVTFFLSIGFSIFLFRGYRKAPIQQNQFILTLGIAIAVSAVMEFLDIYGAFQPLEPFVGNAVPLGFLLRQLALIAASVILFWYSYTTYYFIVKSSPPKEEI